jgi:hypothetical protein
MLLKKYQLAGFPPELDDSFGLKLREVSNLSMKARDSSPDLLNPKPAGSNHSYAMKHGDGPKRA